MGHTDTVADKSTVLKPYRTLIRSNFDYSCIVHDSKKKYSLQELDSIDHQGLRTDLGCLPSLFNSKPLCRGTNAIIRTSTPYIIHELFSKSLPENPWSDSINNPPHCEIFEKSKTDHPFGTRIMPRISEADIGPTVIDIDSKHDPPPPPAPKVTDQYYV